MKSIFIIFFVLGFGWISVAEAIPAFARKHDTQCTACHTAWPSLNEMGRNYKENGYRLSREDSSGGMGWDKTPLVSTMLKARPYEDTDSGAKKLRVLHEVELMIAGEFAEGFSGFVEIEAEDDVGDGFAPEVPVASIGWHPMQAANVQFSWGSATWSDPYEVYSNARKLTRNRASVYNQKFEGADNGSRLRSARQNFTLYGRPVSRLFYSVSVNGVGGDPLAENGETFSGRLAVDVMPSIMLGAMAMSGTCAANANEFVGNCDVERKFTRTSVDAQADFGSFRIMGAFMQAEGDNAAGTSEEKNQAMFGEARYIISQNGRPAWMPLIRVDSYEKNSGADDYFEVTLHLTHYFKQNVRAFVEYLNKSAPDAANDDYTVTAQLEIGF